MNPASSDVRLPHFIIIGAMKSATSTLQEQLTQQPGIFMCDPKEPNFFSDDAQYHRGTDWYASLFSASSAGSLLGEASTHYTKLPTYPDTVARMFELLPDAKLIYVMRHPVDRLVSHYMHEWSMGKISCSIDEAVQILPEMITYGEYASQLQPFFATYGPGNVLPVFFDRLTRAPQAELERVCDFIGYNKSPVWVTGMKPSNVSSERLRRFPMYDMVVKSAIATRVRRTVVPQGLRNWIKARLTMRQRPQLGQALEMELQGRFDRDLALLGEWLGCPLNCANFKQLTASEPMNWKVTNV